MVEISDIRNKIKRQRAFTSLNNAKNVARHRARAIRAKLEEKHPELKEQRLKKNITKTIDMMREFDETFVDKDDAEIADDLAQEELGSYFHNVTEPVVKCDDAAKSDKDVEDKKENIPAANEASDVEEEFPELNDEEGSGEDLENPKEETAAQEAKDDEDPIRIPKILITSNKYAESVTKKFCEELVSIFPNSNYIKRQSNYTIKHIAKFSANRGYTSVIVVNENHKVPNAITLVQLPHGPTAYFRLNSSSIKNMREIPNRTSSDGWFPEVILKGFGTRLGCTIGKMFSSLVPSKPEVRGREVVTFHNQRDFIFFRRHRYQFKSADKVILQEVGPRFTLKLMWLQKGAYDGLDKAEYEWIRKPDTEALRKKFFL